jgi:hypothetical protein
MASIGISYMMVCSQGPRIVMSISAGFAATALRRDVLLVEVEQAEEDRRSRTS